MLEDLDRIEWESRAQPEGNAATTVSAAIRKLAAVSSQEAAAWAYDEFLYAVGNNHRGTYYPVVLETIPFIGRILESHDSWARMAVLDIIIDLVGSFAPEPGYEIVEQPGGKSENLRALLRASVAELSSVLVRLSRDSQQPGGVQRLAREALELLAEAHYNGTVGARGSCPGEPITLSRDECGDAWR
jgi:hypothetical protein